MSTDDPTGNETRAGGARVRARATTPADEPMFNVPVAVVSLAAAFLLVHLLRVWLPEEASANFSIALAFVPARFAGAASELPGGAWAGATSFLTHAFVHGDWGHLAINSMWLAAFGSAVARRVGTVRFLAFFVFCAIAGAATFLAANIGLLAPMVGASGAISGLMGATMRFLFRGLEERGLAGLRETPHLVPLMTAREALTDRRVLTTTGVWLFINLLALLGLGGLDGGGQVAWEAHIGGYVAGLLAFGIFDPAGKAAGRRREATPDPAAGTGA